MSDKGNGVVGEVPIWEPEADVRLRAVAVEVVDPSGVKKVVGPRLPGRDTM